MFVASPLTSTSLAQPCASKPGDFPWEKFRIVGKKSGFSHVVQSVFWKSDVFIAAPSPRLLGFSLATMNTSGTMTGEPLALHGGTMAGRILLWNTMLYIENFPQCQ
jgi:hypothetical protein